MVEVVVMLAREWEVYTGDFVLCVGRGTVLILFFVEHTSLMFPMNK